MDYYALKEVKNMRNACAHNSCVINGFSKSQKSSYQLVPRIYDKLNEAGMKKSKGRNSKLQNPRMQHFVTTLYAARTLTSDRAKARNRKNLEALKDRITENIGMCKNSESIRSFLEFSVKLIDIFR